MMNVKALEELRAAVEAGNRSVSLKGTPISGHGGLYQMALNGSVDAAIQLLEAVLPGWWFTINTSSAMVIDPDPNDSDEYWTGRCKRNPSRALLLATINALIAKHTQNEEVK